MDGLAETRPQGRITVDYLAHSCVPDAEEEVPTGEDLEFKSAPRGGVSRILSIPTVLLIKRGRCRST